MENAIEKQTFAGINSGKSQGRSLMDALKINHEKTFGSIELVREVVVVAVMIHGQKEAFLGTITDEGMVKTPFWHRHISKLHEDVSKVPNWKLYMVFNQRTLETLWKAEDAQ